MTEELDELSSALSELGEAQAELTDSHTDLAEAHAQDSDEAYAVRNMHAAVEGHVESITEA
eukprot:SAG11_NODE_15079_length_590_cov_0.596741_1_plen_61_part_00